MSKVIPICRQDLLGVQQKQKVDNCRKKQPPPPLTPPREGPVTYDN